MDSTKLITFAILFALLYIVINAVLTKIILDLNLGFSKRTWLLALLWLVPFLGAGIVYKILDLGWFKKEPGHKGSDSISTGFLEMDAVFNPSSRYIVEARQEEKLLVQKEGEMYDNSDQKIELDK